MHYGDIGDYAEDVEEILDQGVSTLLDANLPMEAFHLVCAAFEQVVTIDSDDDGELGDVSDYCCEQWRMMYRRRPVMLDELKQAGFCPRRI